MVATKILFDCELSYNTYIHVLQKKVNLKEDKKEWSLKK